MSFRSKKLIIEKCVTLGVFMTVGFASLSMADEACPQGTVHLKSTMGTETCVSQRMADYIACLERVPRRTLHRDDGTKVNANLSLAAQGKIKLLPVSANGAIDGEVELKNLLVQEFGAFKDASTELGAINGCISTAADIKPQPKKPTAPPKTHHDTSNPEKSKQPPSPTNSDQATRKLKSKDIRLGDGADLSGGNCEGPKCDPATVDVGNIECGNNCKIELVNQKSN